MLPIGFTLNEFLAVLKELQAGIPIIEVIEIFAAVNLSAVLSVGCKQLLNYRLESRLIRG